MDFCEKKNEKIILRENILGSVKKNCGKKEKEREMKYGKKNKEKRNWEKCANFLASIFMDAICKIKNYKNLAS